MRALYTDWHLPRKSRGLNSPSLKPWEIAMIIRSTHYSRDSLGLSPLLYCDQETYDYYEKIDLLDAFDEVRPTLPLQTKFNPSVFWAAGKFYAIADCSEKFLMIDLDAELRIKPNYEEFDVFCTHPEGISKKDLTFYPDPLYLDTKNFFGKKLGIEWSDKAYNTCLLYFKSLNMAHEYANIALEFMDGLENINPAFERIPYILLTEQRFLYEFCRVKKLNVGFLIDGKYVPANPQSGIPTSDLEQFEKAGEKGFMHVWGFKNMFYESQSNEDNFFGTLIASNPNLRDRIVNSVTKSLELFPELMNNI